MTPSWAEARARQDHPAFASVRAQWSRLPAEDWPDHATLNTLVAGLANIRKAPLSFVSSTASHDGSAVGYETAIAERGEIPTRSENWHDFFNALAWAAWPQTKAAISELHARIIEQSQGTEARQRSVARDVLTLFDESGCVLLAESTQLVDAVRGFRWREAFVDLRGDWHERATVLSVGHALMEKMLDPHIGLTAKALLLPVAPGRLAQAGSQAGRAALMREVDAELAAYFLNPDHLVSTRSLQPLPVLGIPGWDARNESPDFYDNTDYFRPGRMRDTDKSSGAARTTA